VAGLTLGQDRAAFIFHRLWVRLDSNPVVPYTGLPKAD
jgi:hypothetical protein